MKVTIPFRGLLTNFRAVGTILIFLIARKQEDALGVAEREDIRVGYHWIDHYRWRYSFYGTPAEYRRFLLTAESYMQHNPNSKFTD